MNEFTLKKNGYKAYTPTVSKRKLRQLTLITEKNVVKAMGDINRFVKKPCVQMRGFKQEITGKEDFYIDGHKHTRNIYGDKYFPFYNIYLNGKC